MTASGRSAERLAEAINSAISQPANINDNELIVRPTEQGGHAIGRTARFTFSFYTY